MGNPGSTPGSIQRVKIILQVPFIFHVSYVLPYLVEPKQICLKMIRNYPCKPPFPPKKAFIFQIYQDQMCSISNHGCGDFKNLWLAVHSDTDKNNRPHLHCQASLSKGVIKIHPSFIQRVKHDTYFLKELLQRKWHQGISE